MEKLKKPKEISFIEKIARRARVLDADVVVSIGDDAAVVKGAKGKYTLYTIDMLVESTHFKKNEDPENVGYKAMAVSVSDIAAMGGIPKYALVSVGLPSKNMDRLSEKLFKGILLCAKKFNISIIGGDTNHSQKLVVDVCMVGEVKKKNLTLRSGAKTGDHIFVSGPLGGSLAGRHLKFIPRLDAACFLVKNFKVNAMIDLSDGLAMDLNRIAEASSKGAFIFENRIPRSKTARTTENALSDGEDFELLFTLSAQNAFRLHQMMRKKQTDLKFYQIGRITDLFKGVKMLTADAKIRDIVYKGFKHF